MPPLRDIQMPAAIGWWPFAPIWWFIFLLAGSALLFVGYTLLKKYRRYRQQQQLLRQVQQLQQQYKNDDKKLVQALSRFLRALAIHYYGRETVASLTHQEWLHFLDESAHSKDFSQGVGKNFASSPYDALPVQKLPALLALVRLWIKKHPVERPLLASREIK